MKKIIFSRQDAKTAKVFLGVLGLHGVGQGRKQDAKALRLCESHD